jgi:hypothetical protein
MLAELCQVRNYLAEVRSDWNRATDHKKGNSYALARARDLVDELILEQQTVTDRVQMVADYLTLRDPSDNGVVPPDTAWCGEELLDIIKEN